MLAIFGLLTPIFQGLMSGLVTPLVGYFTNKTTTTAATFTTAAGLDVAAYQAWLSYQLQIQQSKNAANAWWGARSLYLLVGAPACFHAGALFMVSTIPSLKDYFSPEKLPADYLLFQKEIIASLFVVAVAGSLPSMAAMWIGKKSATP